MPRDSINLYVLVLISVLGVVLVGLGGGLWGQQMPWQWQWQHQAFEHLCHQLPNRSIWMGGQPMAVCSRCIGIYAGFAVGWLLLPFAAYFNLSKYGQTPKFALIIIAINAIDIVGNILGFWQNTLVSRLALGSLLGMVIALLFSSNFFGSIIKSMGNHHGRITISDT